MNIAVLIFGANEITDRCSGGNGWKRGLPEYVATGIPRNAGYLQ
jgi:hypothetical protein